MKSYQCLGFSFGSSIFLLRPEFTMELVCWFAFMTRIYSSNYPWLSHFECLFVWRTYIWKLGAEPPHFLECELNSPRACIVLSRNHREAIQPKQELLNISTEDSKCLQLYLLYISKGEKNPHLNYAHRLSPAKGHNSLRNITQCLHIFFQRKHVILDGGWGIQWIKICTQRSLVNCEVLVHPLPSLSLYKSFSGSKGSLFNCFSSHPPTQTFIQRAQDVQKCGGWK